MTRAHAMTRLNKAFLLALGLTLLLPTLMQAAPGGHGGGHGGGGHFGGRGRVFVGVGGGWWGWGWGWPWYGPGYDGYYRPYNVYGPASQWGVIDTDISPEEARVYLDGRYIGTADDFDGYPDYLYLRPGHYRIEFRLDGYETLVREVDARPGMYLDFKDKLHKIAGAKRHAYSDPPKLEGEVRRYFGKRQNSVQAIEPSESPEAYVTEGDDDNPPPANPPPAVRRPRRAQSGDDWQGNAQSTQRDVRSTRLRLTVEPSDAAVYVDNRFVGTAEESNSLERGIAVSPGKHTVTVSRPGFKDRAVDVDVKSGDTEKVEVSLGH
jgi:PEGA domain